MGSPRVRMLRSVLAALGVAAALFAGCKPGPRALSLPRLESTRLPRADEPHLEGPPGLPALVVAELASSDREVLVARRGERALIATNSAGKWLVGPVRRGPQGVGIEADPEGVHELAGAVTRGADASSEVGPSVLRAHGEGYLLAWVAAVGPEPREHVLTTLRLDLDGNPKGEAHEVARSAQAIDWVDLLSASPDDATAYLVWDHAVGGRVEVDAAHVGPAKVDAPARIFSGRAWHGAALGGALFLAGAELGPAETSAISIYRASVVDDRLAVARTTVLAEATALPDVQVSPLGAGLVVAWTDVRDADAHVYAASLAADATVTRAAAPVVEPVGGHALVALLGRSGGEGGLVVFEREASAPAAERTFELCALGKDGRTGPRAELATAAGSDVPHFVTDGAGFGALALAPMRLAGSLGPFGSLAAAPHYLRFDAGLRVRAAEPIRVAELDPHGEHDGVPELVRALECRDALCTLVAHGHGSPSLLALVELPVRSSPWAAPLAPKALTEPARATALSVLVEVDGAVAEFDAVRLSDGRLLVAWVTEPDARGDANASGRLELCFVEADGRVGEVVTLSEKAIALGGVDVELVPEPGKSKGALALIGWSGPNAGAQVFVTQIDARGRKLRQKAVTKLGRGATATEVFDVEVAAVPSGGALVAWSDTRSGEPAIYAARVDDGLERKGREERLSPALSPATEPDLLLLGGQVLVAWSTTRAAEGAATISVNALDAATARALGAPRELYRSAGHAHTPRLFPSGGKALLAWLDESRSKTAETAELARVVTGEGSSGLYLVAVDERGQPLAQARLVRQAASAASSAAVSCDGVRCRGVVAGASGSELTFGAFDAPFESGAPVVASTFASLSAAGARDVQVALAPTVERLVFAEARNGKTRLRLLELEFAQRRTGPSEPY